MKKTPYALLACGLALTLSSCVIPRSYPDPQIHQAANSKVVRLQKPLVIDLEVETQRQGKPLKGAAKYWTNWLEKSFAKTNQVTVVKNDPAAGQLHVLINNYADTKKAAAKGFGSGLTLGVVGISVSDNYDATFNYHVSGGTSFTKTYQHALHSLIGATAKAPEGVKTTTMVAGVEQISDDFVKMFLAELAKK